MREKVNTPKEKLWINYVLGEGDAEMSLSFSNGTTTDLFKASPETLDNCHFRYGPKSTFSRNPRLASVSLEFAVLVKWAVQLLGHDVTSRHQPRQFLDIKLNNAIRRGDVEMKPSVRRQHTAVIGTRDDRGLSISAPKRSSFKHGQPVTINGVTLSRVGELWTFSRNNLTFETAVRFAVRILRDELTRSEWSGYHVPWLADDQELQLGHALIPNPNSGGELVPATVGLPVLFVDGEGTIALIKRGDLLVVVHPEEGEIEDSSSGPLFSGELEHPVIFEDWSDLVDCLAQMAMELPPTEIRKATVEVPIGQGQERFVSWVVAPGARSNPFKEAQHAELTRRFGQDKPADVGLRLAGDRSVTVALFTGVGEDPVVARYQPRDGISITTHDGKNPAFSLNSFIRLLAVVLGDEATKLERQAQFGAFLPGYLKRVYGQIVIESAVESAPQSVPTPTRVAAPTVPHAKSAVQLPEPAAADERAAQVRPAVLESVAVFMGSVIAQPPAAVPKLDTDQIFVRVTRSFDRLYPPVLPESKRTTGDANYDADVAAIIADLKSKMRKPAET